MNRAEATFKFFKSLKNLVDQGLIKSIDQAKAFAKQEFGEVSDLMTLQINKIFKNKNQPVVGKKDPVFDNTVETIPFDDAGAPFNPKDPQKVYGKPKEVDTGSPFEDYRRNVLGEGKNKPLDPDDVLPNYNETPGEFARRQTPGSKENILEQMKAAYPQRYNNLTGNETAAELKGIMEKANKTDVPFSTTSVNKEIKRGVAEILSDTSPAALKKSIEVDDLMLKYPGMSRELAKQIASDPDPARKAQVISMVEQTIKMGDEGMSGDEIIDIFKKGTDRTKQAKGGRIKMAKGGLPNILGF